MTLIDYRKYWLVGSPVGCSIYIYTRFLSNNMSQKYWVDPTGEQTSFPRPRWWDVASPSHHPLLTLQASGFGPLDRNDPGPLLFWQIEHWLLRSWLSLSAQAVTYVQVCPRPYERYGNRGLDDGTAHYHSNIIPLNIIIIITTDQLTPAAAAINALTAVMQPLIVDDTPSSADVDRTTAVWPDTASKPVEMSCRRRRHDINRAKSVSGRAVARLSLRRSHGDSGRLTWIIDTKPVWRHAGVFIRTKLPARQRECLAAANVIDNSPQTNPAVVTRNASLLAPSPTSITNIRSSPIRFYCSLNTYIRLSTVVVYTPLTSETFFDGIGAATSSF